MNELVRVMVVSSDTNSSAFIKMQLELAGFNVTALCLNGNEAIITVKENTPDYIIMDTCLDGEIDGIQAAREILTDFKTNIILLTDYQKMDLIVKAMDMKNVRYFVKPFDIGKVKQVIEEAMAVCA